MKGIPRISGFEDPLFSSFVEETEKSGFLLVLGEEGSGRTSFVLRVCGELGLKPFPVPWELPGEDLLQGREALLFDHMEMMSTFLKNIALRMLRKRRHPPVFITLSSPVDELSRKLVERCIRNAVFIKPLRERGERLVGYAYTFAREASRRMGKPLKGIDGEVLRVFRFYHWPRNLKELKETVEIMVASSRDGYLSTDLLPGRLRLIYGRLGGSPPTFTDLLRMELEERLRKIEALDIPGGIFHDIISMVEEVLIKVALEKSGYVKTKAARFLGLNRNTLSKKMKEYGIGEGL